MANTITAQTYQFLNQQGLLRFIDVTGGGVTGPGGTQSFWLVPTNGYFNGQRAPHAVTEELAGLSFDKQTIDGVEYSLIPEESSNTPGLLSHYAQRTGVAELQNPSGGGVNRVRETLLNSAEATVAPEAVAKYVEDNDSHEEARKKASESDAQVDRAVTVSPAREGSEGKLVETETAGSDNSPTSANAEAPKTATASTSKPKASNA